MGEREMIDLDPPHTHTQRMIQLYMQMRRSRACVRVCVRVSTSRCQAAKVCVNASIRTRTNTKAYTFHLIMSGCKVRLNSIISSAKGTRVLRMQGSDKAKNTLEDMYSVH